MRSDRLAAIPQFLAELAALVATYGVALRIGFRQSSASFAALLLGTFALVALEATTTQNDLVVASLVAAGAYFVLGATPREGSLAGIAIALALGTKLTTAVTLPALVLLSFLTRPSKRTIVATISSVVVTFAALDSWLYVRNSEHTGHLLGYGGGRVEHSPALTAVGWLATVIRILYRLLDFSGLKGTGPSYTVAAAGAVLSAVLAVLLLRFSAGRRSSLALGRKAAVTATLTPILWPLVVLTAAAVSYVVLSKSRFPIDPSGTSEGIFSWHPSTRDHEDFSYFGPLGALLLAVVAGALRRRVWLGQPLRAAVATFFPLFLAGVALAYRFNDFIGRFMLVPVVVVAALLAAL